MLQEATVAEISAVAGGARLLAALQAAEMTSLETVHGPPAKIDLDMLWIFIGEVSIAGIHPGEARCSCCLNNMH